MTAAVEARDLVFRVEGRNLVDDISFDVMQGERVAVVGPNGAGKTSLLRLLAADTAPSAGSVRLAGQSVAGRSTQHLALLRSYLGQHPREDIPFSARQVVAMGRYPHRGRSDNTPADDERAVDQAKNRSALLSHLAPRDLSAETLPPPKRAPFA